MSAQFADKSKTEALIPLDHPIALDGAVWDAVRVHAPTVAGVKEFSRAIEAARAAGDTIDGIRLPMFDAPEAVLDALHLDDDDKLNEASLPFLPRRFRADTPAKPLAADSGDI